MLLLLFSCFPRIRLIQIFTALSWAITTALIIESEGKTKQYDCDWVTKLNTGAKEREKSINHLKDEVIKIDKQIKVGYKVITKSY